MDNNSIDNSKTTERKESAPLLTSQDNNKPLLQSSSTRHKALTLILVPIALWTLQSVLFIIDLNNSMSETYTSDIEVVEVSQNPILGFVNLVGFLLSPLLLIMLVWGVVLLFQGRKHSTTTEVRIPADTQNSSGTKAPSYKPAVISFIGTLGLLLCTVFLISSVRSSAGYSGSEGEIGVIPLVLSTVIMFVVFVVIFLRTFARRHKHPQNTNDTTPDNSL